MSLNTFTLGLNFTDLPEFCSPDDLSDGIVSLRRSQVEEQKDGRGWLAPLSDDGIRRLVKLAFYTSFATEEGRYPQFRMMSANVGADSLWKAATFNLPISDMESLRRLAPAASETDSALLITEMEGQLHCTGSVIVGDMGFSNKIGRPEIVGVGRSPSLIVRVDGPGRLRVSEGFYTLLLDAGRIRQVVDYGLVPQVRELWDELAIEMADVTAQVHGEESRKYFGGYHTLAEFIHKAWSSVLASAVDRRHGGAFVILPKAGLPEQFSIHCKHAAQMPFADDISEFWQSCVSHARCAKDNHEARNRAEHAWNWRRSAVFTKARVLAGLSCIDGCVVLDRRLRVVGFGGEIRIDDERLRAAPRALRNKKTGELTPEAVIEQMGTRHRSAYRLARLHAGTIVFVISQDGDLRVFCSDEHDVFGFDRLHAWVHQHECE